MKEGYENILERHLAVEEKVEQAEQQLELTREALEVILMRLTSMGETLEGLLEAKPTVTTPNQFAVQQTFDDWLPAAPDEKHK